MTYAEFVAFFDRSDAALRRSMAPTGNVEPGHYIHKVSGLAFVEIDGKRVTEEAARAAVAEGRGGESP